MVGWRDGVCRYRGEERSVDALVVSGIVWVSMETSLRFRYVIARPDSDGSCRFVPMRHAWGCVHVPDSAWLDVRAWARPPLVVPPCMGSTLPGCIYVHALDPKRLYARARARPPKLAPTSTGSTTKGSIHAHCSTNAYTSPPFIPYHPLRVIPLPDTSP